MKPLSRMTPATLDVLGALIAEPPPTWGLRLVGLTGRPTGSVYPILERLERAEWISSEWEDDPERSGPRRRLYRLTADGAEAARAAMSRAATPRPALRPGMAGA
jgi:PadR family transcriptional regulator, regulatory protein PadR